jgi:tetratricopeptide (TPR) repeat protein
MASISLPNWFNAKLPSFSRDYFFRSIAWYEKGHFREALDDINRSVALDPAEASAQHHRGNVLFALNQLQEAVGAYEQALTLSPGEAGIWNNLAAALAALGRSGEALNAYERATACSPPSKNAFVGAALLETRLGRLDEAARTLAKLDQLAANPAPEALAIRAVLARKQGDLAKADSLERAARLLDPGAASWAIERASE